ncbi:MAG TPA: T9SS type A sorting domain-containing protein, partial [Emticicia sp.]
VILSVYPNPTKSTIELLASEDLDNHLIKLRLLRNTGQVISEREGYWKILKGQVNNDLSDQSAGIYLLSVKYGDKNKVFRVYKE